MSSGIKNNPTSNGDSGASGDVHQHWAGYRRGNQKAAINQWRHSLAICSGGGAAALAQVLKTTVTAQI